MRRLTLVPIFAALMVLGAAGPARAVDICDSPDFMLFPAEVGLCQAYCTHMDCDNINDGDPFSSAQASEAACTNVGISFLTLSTSMPRSEFELADVLAELDDKLCLDQPPAPPQL